MTDIAILASTKLRSRRIRTIITVIISGLLFAGLITVLIASQGVSNSINDFMKEGLNNRYIVQAQIDPPLSGGVLEKQDLKTRAQQIYNQTIINKKAEAKTLGIDYDSSTEVNPIVNRSNMSGQQTETMLLPRGSSAQQAINEYIQKHPNPGLDQLKLASAQYNPTDYFKTTSASYGSGSIVTMQNGLENFDTTDQYNNSQQDILKTSTIERADAQITEPFILKKLSNNSNQGSIPIIITYYEAEQLLNLPTSNKNAPTEQQLLRIKDLYAKAGAITFSACYRNSVSQNQISTAIRQAVDIAKNKSNKDYQKPNLIYGLPANNSCDAATITSDTRSAAEKELAEKQDKFLKDFGDTVDPVQHKFIFRVVGLTPSQTNSSTTTLGGLLQNIVGSSLNGTITIPNDMLDKSSNAALFKSLFFPEQNNDMLGLPSDTYYVEFSDANDARNFIAEKSCTTRADGTCATVDKLFQLNSFGSNSIALQDLQKTFLYYFEIAIATITLIAVIIMSGMIGRQITDNRRETAVFRAIGAKRIDIVGIYSLYAFCLSVYVALFALVIGLGLAFGIDQYLWKEATLQAQLLFGATNTAREFHFFDINLFGLAIIPLIIIISGFISTIFPLVRNVRRSPIKDMREE
jgi:ABC-type lipoprotein release transport system permease subunit